MDERKPSPGAESTPEQPAQSEGRAMLEQAFARGSGHISDAPPAAPERTEHSVMEGLPPAKAERIAAMRRELADLQRQLGEAQQRIATELQERAEDAERIEALEARLQAHEAKVQEDASRATEIASLRAQLSTVAATAEELRREVAARDAQIEEARREQRAVTEQLDTQRSSLEEAKKLVETRDGELEEQRKQQRETTSKLEAQVAELAAITSERDAAKAELAAARAKTREVANQLARFGQELVEGGGDAQAVATSEPAAASTLRTADRPKPPPVPLRAAVATEQPPVEAIVVTEEPKSKSRTGLVLISGVVLGCLATIGFVKSTSSSSDAATERQSLGDSPTAALVSEHPSDPAVESPPQVPSAPAAAADLAGAVPASPAQPTPVADEASGPPNADSETRAVAPAEPATEGVIVLPEQATDHRVFVDNRVVRVKSSRAVVRCGPREIRIGSRGTPRTIDVACGGETAVPAETRDR